MKKCLRVLLLLRRVMVAVSVGASFPPEAAFAGDSVAPSPVSVSHDGTERQSSFSSASDFSVTPEGGQLNILLGGFTAHFNERKGGKDYNAVQNTLGLEFEARFHRDYAWGVAAAYMKNSLDNDSILLGATFKRKWSFGEDWRLGLGVMAGVQNGYPKASAGRDKSDLVPVAYPLAELYWKRIGIYGTCVPNIYTSGFCFAGFKVRALDF